MTKRKIEVCFAVENAPHYDVKNSNVVVVDIFRATSAICAAFANGAKAIIPVPTEKQAMEAKEKGYIVAAERNGQTLPFADFGNSPFNFTPDRVKGKEVAYSTTNGTRAISVASQGKSVIIGSFINISAVTNWIVKQSSGDILVLCAGWKGRFCLEDPLFAGALAQKLLATGIFFTDSDSTHASMQLWDLAKNDIMGYLENVAQRHRLKRMGLDDVLEYCFTPDSSNQVPTLLNGKLVVED
ncbi:MAG: 2-phosphosulfolactate phosphatase [Bacteroidales bacterium]